MGGGQAYLTVCQSCMVALLSAGCLLSLTLPVGSDIWAVQGRLLLLLSFAPPSQAFDGSGPGWRL